MWRYVTFCMEDFSVDQPLSQSHPSDSPRDACLDCSGGCEIAVNQLLVNQHYT